MRMMVLVLKMPKSQKCERHFLRSNFVAPAFEARTAREACGKED